MVTQIINADPTAIRAVTIPNTPSVGEALPILRVGEVVRFNVRQNPGNGQPGLIFINGQLVPAALPEFLNPGSRVLAKIANVEEKIVFRILQQNQPLASQPGGPTAQVATDIQNLIRQGAPNGLRGLQPTALPPELKALSTLNPDLTKLFAALDANSLTDPSQVLKQVIASANGNLASALRTAADALRELSQQPAQDLSQRFLSALNSELTKLLHTVGNNEDARETLNTLINVLTREVKDQKSPAGSQRELMRAVLADLKNARADMSEVKEHLEQATNTLQPFSMTKGEHAKSAQTSNRMEVVAKTLEQMATTQETLRTLNPLMHALGEPALVLLPFVFQGLLSHGEVSIDPDARRKQQSDAGDRSDEANNTESYQRFQISVPLPALGTIDVDVAHRSKEILVRLTTPESDRAQFLLEQLEHLAGVLRSLGFERAELTAAVAPSRETVPAWSEALHAKTSIVA